MFKPLYPIGTVVTLKKDVNEDITELDKIDGKFPTKPYSHLESQYGVQMDNFGNEAKPDDDAISAIGVDMHYVGQVNSDFEKIIGWNKK